MSNIICTNLVEGSLLTNYALFKHPTNEDEDKGECFFDMPVYNEISGKYEICNIYGFDVQGTEFSHEVLEDTEGELTGADLLNPTKVFWFIVKKIKQKLCPTCM